MAAKNSLRYINVDFASAKNAILQRIRSRYPKLWNDFLSSSFGVVLVDMIAWVTSTLAFTINRQAAENYIPSMTLRESAVRIGALTGYKLRGPVPAAVSVEATLDSAESSNVVIAKGTLIRTSDSSAIPFEVAADATILAGSLTPRTSIVTFNPASTGANVLATFVTVTNGSQNVDLIDTSTDLTQYVETGQTFQAQGDSSNAQTISDIEAAPNAISNNRIVLSNAWTGASGVIAAEVIDTRIVLTQGQTVEDQFVSPSIETPNFSIKLTNTPVVDGSTLLTVNGVTWEEVTTKANAGIDDEVYEVKTLTSGETIIVFGDGDYGSLIPTEATIDVSYRVGGGLDGNIELNTINSSITGLVANTNNPVTINITNSTSTGVGGRDSETLEEARINIPADTKAQDRAVTLSDYQTIAQAYTDPNFGSVAYARPVVRTQNNLLEGNVVTIYAWTTGAGGALANLSSPLKQAFLDYMQTKSVGTDYVVVADGTQVPVPVSLRFKVLDGYDVSDTKVNVQSTLSTFISSLLPGDPVVYSDLVRDLDSTAGVDNLDIATPITDLIPSSTTELFIRPDSTHVYDIDLNGSGTPVYSDEDGANINLYTAQMPVFPLQAWSFKLFLGTEELTVTPGIKTGFAQVYGTNLSIDEELDSSGNRVYGSTVNLLTGAISLWIKGVPGDLTMQLRTIEGYSTERSVNIFVGYTGTNTSTKRSEIRSALKAWSLGLPIGGHIYGSRVSGVTASKSSITDVITSVSGVDSVNRVALETPANTEARVSALSTELLRLGNIVLNNQID